MKWNLEKNSITITENEKKEEEHEASFHYPLNHVTLENTKLRTKRQIYTPRGI